MKTTLETKQVIETNLRGNTRRESKGDHQNAWKDMNRNFGNKKRLSDGNVENDTKRGFCSDLSGHERKTGRLRVWR